MRFLQYISSSFFLSFFLLLILFGCNKKENKLPNIILILADDLGYNDVNSYRNFDLSLYPHKLPTAKTPNIDAIAKQGMGFTDLYAGFKTIIKIIV